MLRKTITGILIFSAVLFLLACSPEVDESVQVDFKMVLNGTNIVKSNPNNLGWIVKTDKFKLAVKNFEFTIGGEMHPRFSLLQKISSFIEPAAFAHPGHEAGGEVTGQLNGIWVLNMKSGTFSTIGTATLLEGEYHGFNFYFAKATVADGLAAGDPVIGHSAYIAGSAVKDGKTISFTAQLDEDAGMRVIGGIFKHTVKDGDTSTMVLRVEDWVDLEGMLAPVSLYDNIDFGALDTDDDGVVVIVPGQPAHNILKKQLYNHDFYYVDVKQ
jgi:hypothetical protein